MSLGLAVLIVLGAGVLTALVFFFLDRKAEKPFVPEAARAGPTLIVSGGLFAVLLAFITLAAFQTYNGGKTGGKPKPRRCSSWPAPRLSIRPASATSCGPISSATDARSLTRSGPR